MDLIPLLMKYGSKGITKFIAELRKLHYNHSPEKKLFRNVIPAF